jgi:hypothetical protein
VKTKTLLLALAILATPWAAAPARASFGIADFTVSARNLDGTVDELAATHPFAFDIDLAMNVDADGEPEGVLRAIQVDLPPSLIGNPLNVPRCPQADFEGASPHCPGSTQVGILSGIVSGLGQVTLPVYNFAPPLGSAAAFAISIEGEPMVQRLSLVGTGAASSVRLAGILPPGYAIVDVEEEIWGVPADPAHDPERTCGRPDGSVVEGCSSGAGELPLLTLPASCAEPMRTTFTATSSDPSAITSVATALSRDAGGNPRPLAGCEAVPFDPRLIAQTEPAALAPTSLSLRFEVPQYEAADSLAAASVRSIRVELPPGLALNPSAGSWLDACPPGAVGLRSAAGAVPATFDEAPVTCPPRSRIGSVAIRTPLIDHDLRGSVYLATPEANPFASRLSIYLVVEDDVSGTMLKIPGRLDADSDDGRLTATIRDLPLFPFDDLEIQFSGGPRAPLRSPPGCGGFGASASFTPSTVPMGSTVLRGSAFTLSRGPDGMPCPPAEDQRDAAPSFQAGVQRPRAGRRSPLTIRLGRQDLEQHLGAFDLTLPPGLIADVGSVPLGSAVGKVLVEAGVGPSPLALAGTVYLDGPYEGAPYSLKVVVPARAGPLNLGTIVQRVALFVDPATAQVRVVSDPLPQILSGVPLEIRSLTVDLDRPGFIRNPTSCEPTSIAGSATTALGQTTPLFTRFQVGDCVGLAFRPKLSLRLTGGLARNSHPALTAVLKGGPGEAAISSLGFTLPAGELLDLRHVRGLCGRGVAPERCPGASLVGRLRLSSSFLGEPLEGPVHLRVPSHRLPDLSAELRSSRFRIVLQGRTTSSGGRLGIRFGGIPDVPISKAVLSLPGGRRGIVVNSRSLCAAGAASASFEAHSGKRYLLRVAPRLDGRC